MGGFVVRHAGGELGSWFGRAALPNDDLLRSGLRLGRSLLVLSFPRCRRSIFALTRRRGRSFFGGLLDRWFARFTLGFAGLLFCRRLRRLFFARRLLRRGRWWFFVLSFCFFLGWFWFGA